MNERSGPSPYSYLTPRTNQNQGNNSNNFSNDNNNNNNKLPLGRKETPICFDFVQGKCRRQNCRYQHDFGAVIRHNSRETRICFDHLRGECTRGSLCRFSHDLAPLILLSLEDAAHQVIEPRANGICYDFCRGACPRRGNCPWTHNLIEIAWSTAKQPLHDHQKINILKKVLDVISTMCPHHMSEADIMQLLQQSVPRPKVSSSPGPILMTNSDNVTTTYLSPLARTSSSPFNSQNLSESRRMELPTPTTAAATPAVVVRTGIEEQHHQHHHQHQPHPRLHTATGASASSGMKTIDHKLSTGLGFNY